MHFSTDIQFIVGHGITNFRTNIIVTNSMRRLSMEIRVIAYAFLWLYILEGSLATRKEDLERAAELAVERAAERAAERAVEKALESGNSTTESETIRESYSSVRKYDKSLKLPGTGYTPAQRHEYDRIVREREAAERASAVLKRSVENEGVDVPRGLVVANVDQTAQSQRQRQYYENLQETIPPATSWPFHVTRQLPFPVEGLVSYDATRAADDNQRNNRQRLPSVSAYQVREDHQFPSLYPVKVVPIQTTKPYQQLFHVIPVTAAASTSSLTYPRYINRRDSWVTDAGDCSIVREDGRKSVPCWIYR